MIAKRAKLIVKDAMRWIYNRLPDSVKHSSVYNKTYREFTDLLNDSKKKSKEELTEYQNEKLREIVNYAYENVPYYKDLFDENGIDPASIRTVRDLSRIPLLTKDIIKREGDRMLSRAIPKEKMVCHETGGSTGRPVKFYFEKDLDEAKEKAFVDQIYARIGFRKTDRLASFSDCTFLREAEAAGRKRISKKAPGRNTWVFPYTKIENQIEDYIREIVQIDPEWINIYPSALYRLTIAMQQRGQENPMKHLKGIILKSETLYPYQRELFESFYQTKILHVYGHTEHLCLAGTCGEGLRFHIQPEYGIAEFLPDESGKMELVATGLHNKAMPLIRYQTRDLFCPSDSPCSCGLPYQMIDSVEGRATDFLYLKNGMVVSDIFCDFTTEENNWLSWISAFQIEQREKGKCFLRVVPAEPDGLTEDRLSVIKESVEAYFFHQMDVEPLVVSSIPRTCRGKEKMILSLVEEPSAKEA